MLETLPFDDNIVQFHGSYAQHGNILLVLEYMQVRTALQSRDNHPTTAQSCLHDSAVGPSIQFDRHVMSRNVVGCAHAEFWRVLQASSLTGIETLGTLSSVCAFTISLGRSCSSTSLILHAMMVGHC